MGAEKSTQAEACATKGDPSLRHNSTQKVDLAKPIPRRESDKCGLGGALPQSLLYSYYGFELNGALLRTGGGRCDILSMK